MSRAVLHLQLAQLQRLDHLAHQRVERVERVERQGGAQDSRLQQLLCMFGRKSKRTKDEDEPVGTVDGGEGRGIPLGGRDERPPTGYRSDDDVLDDSGLLWEDEDPADRRKDPLRKP